VKAKRQCRARRSNRWPCPSATSPPARDEALTIGRTVVQERLAACANVVGGITAIYWWQGALEQAGEAVLILKKSEREHDEHRVRTDRLHAGAG
jgi:periplasmic divalent cation tolerance protein